jgi:hypothetical protein
MPVVITAGDHDRLIDIEKQSAQLHQMAVRPSQIRASAAETALLIPGAFALAGEYASLRRIAFVRVECDHPKRARIFATQEIVDHALPEPRSARPRPTPRA